MQNLENAMVTALRHPSTCAAAKPHILAVMNRIEGQVREVARMVGADQSAALALSRLPRVRVSHRPR